MKVTGPSGPTVASGSRTGKPASGFSISGGAQAAPSSPAATASALGGVAGVGSLMALQGVEDATERRRRAIRRGGGLLDRLDELKLALLSGREGDVVLDRLSRTLGEERPADEDPELNALLQQIDVRAAVELAKAELRRKAA